MVEWFGCFDIAGGGGKNITLDDGPGQALLPYYAADSAAGRAAFPYAQNAQSRRLPQPAFSLDAGRVASVHAETDTRGGGRYARITKRGVRSP